MSLPEGRVCTKCGEYKTIEHFHKYKKGFKRQCKECIKEYNERPEVQEREKQRREENREKNNKRAKEWSANNKERKAETNKKWYEANREHNCAKSREWRENNLEYARNREKEYNETHKEERRASKKEYYVKNAESIKEKSRNWYHNNKDRGRYVRRSYQEAHKETIKEYKQLWQQENKPKIRASSNRRRALKMNAEGSFTDLDIITLYESQLGLCVYCGCDLSTGYDIEHSTPLSRGGSNWPDNLQLTCKQCNSHKHIKTHDEFVEYLKVNYPDKYEKYLEHQDYIETLKEAQIQNAA